MKRTRQSNDLYFLSIKPKNGVKNVKSDFVAPRCSNLLFSPNRQKMNQKTHINQMSIDEINQLLADPIIRKELTPQIIFNDKFDVVTDNLGEILALKISE